MHWIDPDSLPETAGVVDCFLLNPAGDSDGLILTDGTEVHFPPHLSAAVLRVLAPGRRIRIRGVRPRGVAMIVAVALAPEEGPFVVDEGPDPHPRMEAGHRHPRQPMLAKGVARQILHGPHGEIRGVLLEDGRSGRFPPHAAPALVPLLRPGGSLVMQGEGCTTPHGTVIAVRALGPTADDLMAIEPAPKKGKKKQKHKGARQRG